MGRLTTHVLDTSLGKPGVGIAIDLYRVNGERRLLASAVTNADGRCDQPLLQGADFQVGTYDLVFQAGAYFDAAAVQLTGPRFLVDVVIRFAIGSADEHYHVPLLLSPYSYSTYRGS